MLKVNSFVSGGITVKNHLCRKLINCVVLLMYCILVSFYLENRVMVRVKAELLAFYIGEALPYLLRKLQVLFIKMDV